MSLRSTSSTGSTGAGPPLVTARDRCPQLEADQESLAALRLEVSSWDKAEETLTALARSRHLRELGLESGCGDEEVGRLVREALLPNRSLNRLTLDFRECSDGGTAHLAELIEKSPTVKHLTLMLNRVTSQGAESLAASLPHSSLLSLTLYATQMDLHDCCVGDEGVRHFANVLDRCKSLAALGITQSGVTKTGLGYLLQRLESNQHINSLNLHSNFIDHVGAANLSQFLSTSSRLKQLILNENHYIGDDGARELALSLSHNSTLEVLSLRSCGIGRRGAEHFATSLSKNGTLRVLNLCGNPDVGDDGVEMIARGLKSNKTLQQLDLSSCGVTDEGCDHLAGVLCNSGTGITHLTLHKNAISDGGTASIAHALTKNSSLTVLVLSDNPIGEKGLTALGQALEHNTTLTSLALGNSPDTSTQSPKIITIRKTRAALTTSHRWALSDDAMSSRSPAVKRAGLSVAEGGGRKKGVVAQSAVRLGGGQHATPTLVLVEVLVSKNRKLAAYKKTIRELRQRVKELEESKTD